MHGSEVGKGGEVTSVMDPVVVESEPDDGGATRGRERQPRPDSCRRSHLEELSPVEYRRGPVSRGHRGQSEIPFGSQSPGESHDTLGGGGGTTGGSGESEGVRSE